jgi:hypothetical protein
MDGARQRRRRRVALADHDLHRVLDVAVLVHPQLRGGGVNDNVAAARREHAGALEVGEHTRIGNNGRREIRAACHLRPCGVAKLGVERVHRRHRLDVLEQGRRSAGVDQDALGRRRLGKERGVAV